MGDPAQEKVTLSNIARNLQLLMGPRMGQIYPINMDDLHTAAANIPAEEVDPTTDINCTEPLLEEGQTRRRDKKNDTRINKKGWPKSDNDLLKRVFVDFIEGKTKYPPPDSIQNFLKSFPNFLSTFELSDNEEKKEKIRSQLNNLKKSAKIRRKKEEAS